MEREIASNLCAVGTQLGKHNNNFHIPSGDKTSDIHDECDRVTKWSAPEPYQDEADTRQR